MMLELILAVFFASLVESVRAECSPTNGVVAVISVVTTLVVVAVVLVIIYFVLRRRQQKGPFLKTTKSDNSANDQTLGDDPDGGYFNSGFEKTDPGLAEEGLITVDNKGSRHEKTKRGNGKQGNTKTWSSFPEREQPGILYRPGSCGSLDDNMYPNPEIVTVCLESQDIIGLGFNISGNFGEGIQVSQVHNRGPAVESGKVKVGDKIRSVEVSYENIVYEDALTILSYASPYPVKITLQKGDVRHSRESALYKKDGLTSGEDEKVVATQLNHPLYRSQSLDAFKHLGRGKDANNPPFQPKRTQSEMKPETRKDGGKNRKKGDRNSKSFVHDVLDKIAGTISPSKSTSANKREVDASDVVVHHSLEGKASDQIKYLQESSLPPQEAFSIDDQSDNDKDETPQANSSAAMELATFMDDKFDLKHEEPDTAMLISSASLPITESPTVPPSKPERKNKKQGSFEFQNVSLDSSRDETEESSTSEIDEEIIVPSAKKRPTHFDDEEIQLEPLEFHPPISKKYEDINDCLTPLTDVQILIVNLDRCSSPEQDSIIEDMIEATNAKRDQTIVMSNVGQEGNQIERQEIGINTESNEETEFEVKAEEKLSAPALDEAMLERLIAMNSYEPGTQGWAGIHAGGDHGGIADDFVPNTRDFIPQPVKAKDSNDSSASHPMSPPSVAFEIRDNVTTGASVAVGIKSRHVMRDSSPSTAGNLNVNNSNLRDNSNSNPSYVANKVYSTSKTNSRSNNNNNDSDSMKEFCVSSPDSTLDRVTFSTKSPEIGSESDWRDSKSVDNKIMSSHQCIDDLTDSDSEVGIMNSPSRIKIQVSESITNRPKIADNSDISSSFTSSSGEATPPYPSNGQELGSSPEFSLSKSPLAMMSRDMDSENKSNPTITLTLQSQDNESDVEC